MALKYIVGHAGTIVMINEELFFPQNKIKLHELILFLLDKSDFMMDD
ncbi:hypothetical protein ID853_08055 [Xenorhabdus sp. Vera]|nr:hypothetical protein [Xenorhabdus sp. Vera]MBD2810832.1 hypothetical protein [Xenorhabdus sp. Vera]